MKNKASLYSYIACLGLMLYATFIFYPKWQKPAGESTLGWDVSGYYWYLPSALIYKDLKQQEFGDSIIAKYQFTPSFSQSYIHESGNRVIRYSSGMAVIYLPLFYVAHVLAEPFGYPADGFSKPYQFALQVGSVLMSLIAIWYFRKLFLLFFDDKAVALLLLLLVFGTNYLNYSAIEGALTHSWLFMLYVFLLLNTIFFYEKPRYQYAIRIGVICGLLVLIRPSEIISVLLPLLWGMERLSVNAIRQRLNFLKEHKNKIAVAASCTILVGMFQVVYWLYTTGQPLVYSYEEKGFSWLHPHFKDYILSYRSGWITYTPLMILCFIGIPFFIKHGKNKLAILSFFALNLYIVSAWDIWWYGGTGGRAMIQSYPIILFPFAYCIQYIYNKRLLAWLASPIIILLAYFNIWFTYNAHAGGGLYDSNGMTKAYYWNVIYRYHVPPEIEKLKDTDELFVGDPKEMRLLFANDFETDTVGVAAVTPAIKGEFSASIGAGKEHIQQRAFLYSEQGKDWIRAQATFRCTIKEWEGWKMPQFIVRFLQKEKVVKDKMIRAGRHLNDGQTKDLFIDVKIPREDFDSIKVFVWNPGSDKTVLIDDVRVWSFKE